MLITFERFSDKRKLIKICRPKLKEEKISKAAKDEVNS